MGGPTGLVRETVVWPSHPMTTGGLGSHFQLFTGAGSRVEFSYSRFGVGFSGDYLYGLASASNGVWSLGMDFRVRSRG